MSFLFFSYMLFLSCLLLYSHFLCFFLLSHSLSLSLLHKHIIGIDDQNAFSLDTTPEPIDLIDQLPNELHILVKQGRNLLAMDTGIFQSGLSDPLIKVKIPGLFSKRTKYIPKTLFPEWNEVFVEPVSDISKALEITCEDYDIGLKNDIIGKVIIPLRQFIDKKPVTAWYTLGNKFGDTDDHVRGDIELQIQWKVNPLIIQTENQKIGKISIISQIKSVFREKEEYDEVTEDLSLFLFFISLSLFLSLSSFSVRADPIASSDVPLTAAKAKEEQEAMKKMKEDELAAVGAVEIKSGDYRVCLLPVFISFCLAHINKLSPPHLYRS